MNCIKCKAELPSDAVFCHLCGKKQVTTKKRRPRHGNGSGGVWKLSGRRKKPWVAYAPAFKVDGKFERIFLGTFETERLAREAVQSVSPRALKDTFSYTVEDVYETWKGPHFATLTSKGQSGYVGAWKYLEPLKDRRMRDIRPEDLQAIISDAADAGKSRSLCEKIKQLESQLCKWAVDNDVILRNYAERLKLPKKEDKERRIFTESEIASIKSFVDDKRLGLIAQMALVLVYTGMRISELLEMRTDNVNTELGYMVGGNKTAAGKNRVITYPDEVAPYIKAWAEKNNEYLIATKNGKPRDTDSTRRSFNSLMEKLGIAGVSPHTCRRTCATMLSRRGIRPEVISKLLGHADYDTTEIYIINNLEDLRRASDALQCEPNADKTQIIDDVTILMAAE